MHRIKLLLFICLFFSNYALSFELYKTFQTPEAFIDEAFSGQPPAPTTLMLSNQDKQELQQVFGRTFPQSRVRYWKDGEKWVWVFDDIGKKGYVPTTCGFIIANNQVEKIKVLIYRESRGEQVGEDSFLNKFIGAKNNNGNLSVSIDNIAGATLSVKMMERMALTSLSLTKIASRKEG